MGPARELSRIRKAYLNHKGPIEKDGVLGPQKVILRFSSFASSAGSALPRSLAAFPSLVQGHFDIEATEKLMRDYRKNRPAWLKPKNVKKDAYFDPKNEDNGAFEAGRSISKAEQEEMMTKAVFSSARAKTERGQELRRLFKHNLVERTLQRVQSDLSLNRMFLEPERKKLNNLKPYFAAKMVDPNLDIREIMAANPTKFFNMCHRRLRPEDHLPSPQPKPWPET